jgi:hypothetical protein
MPQFDGPAVEAKNALYALVLAIALDANLQLDDAKYTRLVSDVVDGIYAEAVEDAVDLAEPQEVIGTTAGPGTTEAPGKLVYDCSSGSRHVAVYECTDRPDGTVGTGVAEAGVCRFEIHVNGESVASASSQMEAEQEARRLAEQGADEGGRDEGAQDEGGGFERDGLAATP